MCGLGLSVDTVWKNLLAGKSPIKKFSRFELSELPCDYGVELPSGVDQYFSKHISAQNRAQMSRSTRIAFASTASAIEHAELLPCEYLDRTRVGVILGSTGTGRNEEVTGSKRFLCDMISSPVSWINLKWKFIGPSFIVSTACSSGIYALHAAVLLITSGVCDVVICGAVDSSINRETIVNYCSLLALCEDNINGTTAFRPFDIRHQGFFIGEGGAMMVLESRSFARKRGARIRASVPLPGICGESYNFMVPAPHGHAIAQSMRSALTNACCDPSEIDYVNAHGIALDVYDRLELEALLDVFGKSHVPPVSSTKPMTGHCLGASAAIETVLCCKAIETGVIPPTINLQEPLTGFNVDHVMDAPRVTPLRHVMSSSFPFGGRNGVAIISAP
jgi:3-oxoacyl-[acyl-carrier-protein] synthase II